MTAKRGLPQPMSPKRCPFCTLQLEGMLKEGIGRFGLPSVSVRTEQASPGSTSQEALRRKQRSPGSLRELEQDIAGQICAYCKTKLHPEACKAANCLLLTFIPDHGSASTHRQQPLDSRVQRAVEIMNEQWAEPLRISDLSRSVGLSELRFRMLFHHETGMSVTQYLKAKRMSAARALLTSTDLRISEVCQAIGLGDATNSARQFRRVYGCSPTEYRRIQRKCQEINSTVDSAESLVDSAE